MTKKERYQKVLEYFEAKYNQAETELHYSNAYELLVAVILSAQCTDKRVNLVTPALFNAYPDIQHLATAMPEDIFPYIRSVSYPNNKAKHLAGMASMVVHEFNGEIPSEVKDLVRLPGVGRKTAHVVGSVIFNMPLLAVDTHVFRVSGRIGLTTNARTPLETEKQLMKYIPTEKVAVAHHWLILHGRYTCDARKPKCESCGIQEYCRYYISLTKKYPKHL
jgi:endonuclease-3